jgi:hypothetical protein
MKIEDQEDLEKKLEVIVKNYLYLSYCIWITFSI